MTDATQNPGSRWLRNRAGGRPPQVAWLLLLACLGTACASSSARRARVESPPSANQLWQRGVVLAHSGELVHAEQFLVAALEAGAPSERVLPVLLEVCVRAGRPRRALDHTLAALQAHDDDVRLWTLAGALAWGLSDPRLAHLYLTRAAELPDAPSEVAYWLGRVALQQGDVVEAEQQMRRYLERDPEGPFAERARFWLHVEFRLSSAPRPEAPGAAKGGPT